MGEMANRYLQDWLAEVTESTKTEYSYMSNIAIFSSFAEKRGLDFQRLVEVWRRVKRSSITEREDFIEAWNDVVRAFRTQIKKKYAPLSQKNLLATIKSFFGFWEIPIRMHLPKRACVIYHNKDLAKEEVRQILTFATPRDRVIWLAMVESGMRGSTAINMKYWQIKEDFEANRIPMKIMLPASSIKDHVGDRWTFIGEDGFRELQQYLASRLPLQDDDYVFASEKQGKVKGDQFSVSSLSVKFSRVVLKLALAKPRGGHPKAVRMHGLRKYFRNGMKADSAYIKFWMGHSLGADAHYISRDIEKHRQLYNEGYPYLRIYDIDPMIRREDIESIVEARVQEKLAQRKEDQAQEIEILKNRLLNAIEESKRKRAEEMKEFTRNYIRELLTKEDAETWFKKEYMREHPELFEKKRGKWFTKEYIRQHPELFKKKAKTK